MLNLFSICYYWTVTVAVTSVIIGVVKAFDKNMYYMNSKNEEHLKKIANLYLLQNFKKCPTHRIKPFHCLWKRKITLFRHLNSTCRNNKSTSRENISIKPFPKQQNLDPSKLKEFADNNFKFNENGRKFSKHCGKRRNCLLWAISPFPTVFSKNF